MSRATDCDCACLKSVTQFHGTTVSQIVTNSCVGHGWQMGAVLFRGSNGNNDGCVTFFYSRFDVKPCHLLHTDVFYGVYCF